MPRPLPARFSRNKPPAAARAWQRVWSKLVGLFRSPKASEETSRSFRQDIVVVETLVFELRSALHGIYAVLDEVESQPDASRNECNSILRESATRIDSAIDLARLYENSLRPGATLRDANFEPRALVEQVIREVLSLARTRELTVSWSISRKVPHELIADFHSYAEIIRLAIESAIRSSKDENLEIVIDYRKTATNAYLECCIHDERKQWSELLLRARSQANLASEDSRFDATLQRTHMEYNALSEVCNHLGGHLLLADSKANAGWVTLSLPVAVADSPDMESSDTITMRGSVVANSPLEIAFKPAENGDLRSPQACPRALIVDDDALHRRVLAMRLARFGIAVDAVAEAASALRRSQEVRYDMLFLDSDLPGLRGEEIARVIREREATVGEAKARRVPIFGVTGHTGVEDRRRFLEHGMDEIIPKPVRDEALYESLTRWRLLPAQASGTSQDAPPQKVERAPLQRIVALDNNPLSLRIAERAFIRLGFAVDAVSESSEAYDRARKEDYDLLLLGCDARDRSLPSLIEKLRALPDARGRVPIIVCAAAMDSDQREQCFGAGADVYLTKPLAPDIVSRLIRQWAGARSTWDHPANG